MVNLKMFIGNEYGQHRYAEQCVQNYTCVHNPAVRIIGAYPAKLVDECRYAKIAYVNQECGKHIPSHKSSGCKRVIKRVNAKVIVSVFIFEHIRSSFYCAHMFLMKDMNHFVMPLNRNVLVIREFNRRNDGHWLLNRWSKLRRVRESSTLVNNITI